MAKKNIKVNDKANYPNTCNCSKKGAKLFIPAGIFLGFAAGFIFNNLSAGIFGGLGVGFLAFAIATLNCKCK